MPDAVMLTYHGRSCFEIEAGRTKLLVDPFLTGNAAADIGPEDVTPDYILVSHAHGDHLGDAVPIACRTGATIISNAEIADYAAGHGARVHAMHIGGAHVFPFGKVKLTIAHHGSSFDDGSYGGSPCGFLLWLQGTVLYHAGDTALTLDMKLYGEEGIDVAMLPIGDNYTMGPEDVIRAIEFLQPKKAVLMHYSDSGLLAQDPVAVAAEIRSRTSAAPVILRAGETLRVATAVQCGAD